MMRSVDAQPCLLGATMRDAMRLGAVRVLIFVSRRAISGVMVSCAASQISTHGAPGVSFSANHVSVVVISLRHVALWTDRWRSPVSRRPRRVCLRGCARFLRAQIRPPGWKETFLFARLHGPVRVSLVLA